MRVVTSTPHPADLEPLRSTLGFHRELTGYEPTPLVDAESTARELGLERLLVKDESSRFGLPAFKFLGASWAIAQLLGGGSDLAELRRAAETMGIRRLTTATDGNHGRAVARAWPPGWGWKRPFTCPQQWRRCGDRRSPTRERP